MRYAICNETFGDWPLAKACECAASCGYTGLEIAPFTLAPLVTDVSVAARAEIRRTLAAAGLDCIGLHWLLAKTEGFHVTHPDPAVQEAVLRRFQPHMDFRVVAEAGHWAMYERPGAFNAALLAMLAMPVRTI